MLRTWARQLGYDDAVTLLDEEKADELLTSIADRANVEGIADGLTEDGKTSPAASKTRAKAKAA